VAAAAWQRSSAHAGVYQHQRNGVTIEKRRQPGGKTSKQRNKSKRNRHHQKGMAKAADAAARMRGVISENQHISGEKWRRKYQHGAAVTKQQKAWRSKRSGAWRKLVSAATAQWRISAA